MYGTQYFQGPDAPTYEKGLTTMIAVVSAGAFLVIIQEAIYWNFNRKVRAKKTDGSGSSSIGARHDDGEKKEKQVGETREIEYVT